MKTTLIFSLLITIATLAGCTRQAEQFPPPNEMLKVSAAQLGNGAYLRKLSFHLKGENPTLDEYEKLAEAEIKTQGDTFLKLKIAEYLKTPQFAAKMSLRIGDLIRLRGPGMLSHWPRHSIKNPSSVIGDPTIASELELSAYSYLVRDVIEQNKSWDDLLLTEKFRIYNHLKFTNSAASLAVDDAGFFSQAFSGPLPPSRVFAPGGHATDIASDYIDIEFPATFAQAAGVLTTGRFFDRHATTTVNKNRRRAAAIYRVFLCDDMVPVATASARNPDEVLKLVFPEKTMHSGPALTDLDAHGSDSACMKCHSKLDPVGVAFSTSPFLLSARPSQGVLNTERLDGSTTATSYRGLNGLAQALVGQEKYAACQVQHFWSWFIGDDRALDSSRRKELMTTFDRVGRRTGDFISELVQTAEFREAPQAQREETLSELQTLVKPILKRCDSCHTTHPEEQLPLLADDQIGGSAQSHIRNVSRIAKQLDLANGGVGAKMPPAEARWLLSRDERSLLYRWTSKVQKGETP